MHPKRGKKNGCCFADKVRNCFGWGRCNDQVTPLSKRARTGRVKVCKVTGDRKICARMASDVICSETGSQCLLKVNGGTISLDSDVSENIYVSGL
jgi:hypothetical protein